MLTTLSSSEDKKSVRLLQRPSEGSKQIHKPSICRYLYAQRLHHCAYRKSSNRQKKIEPLLPSRLLTLPRAQMTGDVWVSMRLQALRITHCLHCMSIPLPITSRYTHCLKTHTVLDMIAEPVNQRFLYLRVSQTMMS